MSCIVCYNISTEDDINYCGCEKCPICDKDFCNFDCNQNCVVCGIETIKSNYCGCETCICGELFCNYSCENTGDVEENPEDNSLHENN